MKQELPVLVDERRFRRREPEQFERDELGRVYNLNALLYTTANVFSANGRRNGFLSTSSLYLVSISEHKSSVMVGLM